MNGQSGFSYNIIDTGEYHQKLQNLISVGKFFVDKTMIRNDRSAMKQSLRSSNWVRIDPTSSWNPIPNRLFGQTPYAYIYIFSLCLQNWQIFEANKISRIRLPEIMFKINTVPKCPMKILQFYQSDEDMGINVTGRFEVKTKDKTFATSIFPFLQTDHLTDQLIGKP